MDLEALKAEFQEKGIVKLAKALSPEALAKCRALYEETKAKPYKLTPEADAQARLMSDVTGFRGPVPPFRDLCKEGLPDLMWSVAEVMGSKSVWYYDMEIFHKTKTPDLATLQDPSRYFARGGPPKLPTPEMIQTAESSPKSTPYHRDTSSTPFWGPHCINLWITFESCPARHSLQCVAGSMWGAKYQDTKVRDTVASPMGTLGEIVAFDTEPGDVIMLHSGTIHGGGTLAEDFPERTTLVLRLFGDMCRYRSRDFSKNDKRYQGVEDGEHFSKPGQAINLHPLVFGPGEIPALEILAKL